MSRRIVPRTILRVDPARLGSPETQSTVDLAEECIGDSVAAKPEVCTDGHHDAGTCPDAMDHRREP